MLKMECPACEEFITSPFLAEVAKINCHGCNESVVVDDVFVSTKAFTMQRESLLNRVTHYRALLKQIEREKRLACKNDELTEEGNKSLDQLYNSLQELLEGARENYRLSVPEDLLLDIAIEEWASKCQLVNISSTGAAIRPKNPQNLAKQGSDIKLKMVLPGQPQPLSMKAKIAWIGNRGKEQETGSLTMGVYFTNLNEKSRQYIWDYIVHTHKSF